MKNRANLLLALASIGITLLCAELILRIIGPASGLRYAVWPPNLDQLIEPIERDTPGISTPHHFRITAQGYRGRPMGNATLRVVAFGGSTTESLFVPEDRSWPRLLEQRLADALGTPAWIGNFGKSGRNTRQHVLDARYVLPQFPAQVVLLLVGVNDLGLAIEGSPNHEPKQPDEIAADDYLTKALVISEPGPRVRVIALIEGAFRAATASQTVELPHITTEFYRQKRKERVERAGFTSETPDIAPWLDEYARNLALIADQVRMTGALPVFISQPSLWSAGLPQEIEALFWWGWTGGVTGSGRTYYSSEAMGRMMAAYNERLRAVATQKNVPLIDAAVKLRDPKYFYDEMHYNEAGSRALSDIVATDLIAVIRERGLTQAGTPARQN